MAKKDDDFLKKLLATFKVEADEHIHAMASGLISLEKKPEKEAQKNIVETIYREAHSLKGAARSTNLAEIETLCQSLESVFSALKREAIAVSPLFFDGVHACLDFLGALVLSAEAERTHAEKKRLRELQKHLETLVKGSTATAPEKEAAKEALPAAITEKKHMLSDTVRVATEKLDALFLETEELLSAKLSAAQHVLELRELKASFSAWKKGRTKAMRGNTGHGAGSDPDAGQVKQGSDPIYTVEDDFMRSFENKLASLTRSAEQHVRSLGGMTDTLLGDMKKVSMLPFSSLFEILPKLVRDLSRAQGKDMELALQGGEIEIDRRILEEMKDPLIHLVRNSIDHGLEKPDERKKSGKPRQGLLSLSVTPKDGNKIELLISDDGEGIDVEKVGSAAVKLGLIMREEAGKLERHELLSFIFQSGVSTSPILTDLSGRGLGLAIVREKVEKLGGMISVETHPDAGTVFQIALPLTLASFRGVLMREGEHHFIVPTTSVERAARIKRADIKTVENRETIPLDGQTVSLVRLKDALGLASNGTKGSKEDDAPLSVFVLGSAEKRVAFLVDEISSEQEVLVKSLGKQLARVKNISGATLLGTGKVVPVLNVSDLMKSAVKVQRAGSIAGSDTGIGVTKKGSDPLRRILVVEDSITSRTLLKNILEASGYDVKTAVDGMDAMTFLKTETFDVVVSDVEMPRMDGFELTKRIRADKKLSELPAILVTALETREDKERGIDAGASAYIVKSSFDQSNLLEVIKRLI